MRKALVGCGALAGPLFAATFSIAGAGRRGYDPRRHPVSALALGPGGAVQRANFIAAGALYLVGAAGLGKTDTSNIAAAPTPALIAGAGAGLICAALFDTDPVSGYPPGTPDQPGQPGQPAQPSHTGTLHNLCAIPVFVGISAAALLSARAAAKADAKGWAAYSAASGTLMAASNIAAGAGFGQQPALVASAGLLQRVSIVAGFGWVTALCLRA